MNTVLWIIAGLLAAAFLAAGAMKLTKTKQQIVESGMAWAEDFSPTMLKTIGALEVLGALGLVVPPLVGVLPVLAPLAALGLALLMISAAVVHARRGETSNIMINAVLLVLAVVVVWGRFGPYAFSA